MTNNSLHTVQKRVFKTLKNRHEAPKSELGEPKKTFDQTFSAVTALKEEFFHATTPPNKG